MRTPQRSNWKYVIEPVSDTSCLLKGSFTSKFCDRLKIRLGVKWSKEDKAWKVNLSEAETLQHLQSMREADRKIKSDQSKEFSEDYAAIPKGKAQKDLLDQLRKLADIEICKECKFYKGTSLYLGPKKIGKDGRPKIRKRDVFVATFPTYCCSKKDEECKHMLVEIENILREKKIPFFTHEPLDG